MSLKKLVILLILIIPVFILDSCSETPTNVGSDLLDQDKINVQSIDSLGVTSSFFKRTISLGSSSRILLGRKGNVEAGILIKFNFVLADTLSNQILTDSTVVENSWFDMIQDYSYGNETDPFDLGAYKVNSGWTTVGFNSDSLSLLDADTLQNQSTGFNVTDSLTRIQLQPQLVSSWVKAAADTAVPDDNGLYIKAGVSSSRIVGYFALGSADVVIPKLNVVYRKSDGDLDTLVYNALADVGFVKGELPQVSNTNIVVQSGLEVLSRIRFDVSIIPSNAIINKADIILTVDSSETITGDNHINSLLAYFVIDSLNVDSLSSFAILNPDGNTFKGDLTGFIQEWVRTKNNQGLLIAAGGRFNGVELFAIRGSNAEAAVRPKLIITYTTKQ